MKLLMRILYGVVALVFLASGVIQFHHHHSDGSMCLRLHESVCEIAAQVVPVECDGECLAEAHHHCSNTNCSLHLDETEITNNHNHSSEPNGSTHIHSALCAVLCALENVYLDNFTTEASWPDARKLGNAMESCVGAMGLRAPPVA